MTKLHIIEPEAPADPPLCRHFPAPWPQRLSMAARVGEPNSGERIRAINDAVRQMHREGLCDRPAPVGIEFGKLGQA